MEAVNQAVDASVEDGQEDMEPSSRLPHELDPDEELARLTDEVLTAARPCGHRLPLRPFGPPPRESGVRRPHPARFARRPPRRAGGCNSTQSYTRSTNHSFRDTSWYSS